jgi:2'-5' RNA ligase
VTDLVGDHRGILRGVPSRSFHITYAFTAHAPDEAVSSIVGAVGEAVRKHRVITVTLDVPHVIGPSQRPRLVAAAVGAGQQPLGRLAHDVAAEVSAACPQANVQPTKSLHVTLARFGRSAKRSDGRAVAEWLSRRGRARPDIAIGRVQLIQSDLGGPVPVYTILRDVPIEG